MNATQNARSAIVEQIILDPRVIRILQSIATRCQIDWEDLRQALALRLLEKDDHPAVLLGRMDQVHMEVKSIAISLYRQSPQGRLDRLGERSRQERSNGTGARLANNRVTFVSPSFDHEDSRQSIEGVLSRLFVEDAICQVPAKSRDVFRKRIVEEMSFPEIAERSGKRLESIKKQWRSHCPKLREMIQKELA